MSDEQKPLSVPPDRMKDLMVAILDVVLDVSENRLRRASDYTRVGICAKNVRELAKWTEVTFPGLIAEARRIQKEGTNNTM